MLLLSKPLAALPSAPRRQLLRYFSIPYHRDNWLKANLNRRDREFLPAALEILETPPAPLPVALMLALCAFTAAAIVWSVFGKLEVQAIARGKILGGHHANTIQPLESGKVAALQVENGSHVHKGDLLMTMEISEQKADQVASSDALFAARAELARRRVAIVTAHRLTSDNQHTSVPQIRFDSAIPQNFRTREKAILLADLGQLFDTLSDIDKQIEQRDATSARLNMGISVEKDLIKTLQERVKVREDSLKIEFGTKTNLIDARESLQKSQTSLASDSGQLIETRAAISELKSQKIKAISQFVATNESLASEVARKADDMAQQFNKAAARLDRTRLVAPIDGTVQQLAVTTIGQVVTPGQQLLVIVPDHRQLVIEATISNQDIGFVKVGQDAVIKLDAFPYTRFGTLHAKVIKIANDAVDEQDAKRAQANETALANSANLATPLAQGQQQDFVFPVTLSLDADAMKINGTVIPLSSGMTVYAEIVTDKRRVIDYVLSPISKIKSEAMKQR